jgi:glycosyltransferase involved in cell wall biosynthesis
MRRLLVVHSALGPFGGGTGVCAWMLEALQHEHQVSLLVLERPDLAAVNRFFGTSLSESRIRIEVALPAFPERLKRLRLLRRLRQSWLLKLARSRPDVDLVLSAQEESDLGGGGIQYVHFPRHDPGTVAGFAPLRRAGFRLYHRLVFLATGTSRARMRDNVTLVNSDWTGEKLRAIHGIDTITVHPPAAGDFPAVPWGEREDGFVCIGRLTPEKRFELLIDIVGRVRALGRDVHLHIVATDDNRAYGARIAELARRRPWVTLQRHVPRSELSSIIARHRYGLHGMAEEHYGMAAAEMVAGGMLVFVPRGGGQVEIVDDDRLRWSTPDEAVARIVAVLDDARLNQTLRAGLAARREHLRPERFMREIRDLVRRTPNRRPR